jgi:hypothetical protein
MSQRSTHKNFKVQRYKEEYKEKGCGGEEEWKEKGCGVEERDMKRMSDGEREYPSKNINPLIHF